MPEPELGKAMTDSQAEQQWPRSYGVHLASVSSAVRIRTWLVFPFDRLYTHTQGVVTRINLCVEGRRQGERNWSSTLISAVGPG